MTAERPIPPLPQEPNSDVDVWGNWRRRVAQFQSLTSAKFDASQPALDFAKLIADIDAENAKLSTAVIGKWAKLRKYLGFVIRPIEGLGEIAVKAIGVVRQLLRLAARELPILIAISRDSHRPKDLPRLSCSV